ncbi:MAG TPA: hypothetical protein VMR33_23200 [Candidatus Baltobacteraceae bacterium]|jgi:hypothetical protein|nr:hypothetical protein [Candidatus Baltobacteraceae bacterium]
MKVALTAILNRSSVYDRQQFWVTADSVSAAQQKGEDGGSLGEDPPEARKGEWRGYTLLRNAPRQRGLTAPLEPPSKGVPPLLQPCPKAAALWNPPKGKHPPWNPADQGRAAPGTPALPCAGWNCASVPATLDLATIGLLRPKEAR